MEENMVQQNAAIKGISQTAENVVKIAKSAREDLLNTNTYTVGVKIMVSVNQQT
jgi:hypothetical protein